MMNLKKGYWARFNDIQIIFIKEGGTFKLFCSYIDDLSYTLVLTSIMFSGLKRLYENVKSYIEKEEQEDRLKFIKIVMNNLEGV